MKKETQIQKRNIWKIIAITGIAIFLIIILLATIKIIRFNSKFNNLSDVSEEQKEKALSMMKDISNNEGYSLDDYNVRVNDKIIEINFNGQKKHILRVDLESENSIKFYIIDINDWTVVQSSQIKYNSWMMNGQKRFSHSDKRGRWFHNGLWDLGAKD